MLDDEILFFLFSFPSSFFLIYFDVSFSIFFLFLSHSRSSYVLKFLFLLKNKLSHLHYLFQDNVRRIVSAILFLVEIEKFQFRIKVAVRVRPFNQR